MYTRALVVVGLVGVCTLSVLAGQSALVKTGVNAREIQAWAMAAIHESTASDSQTRLQPQFFSFIVAGPVSSRTPAVHRVLSIHLH